MLLDVYLRVSKRRADDRYQSLEGQEAVCRRRVVELGAQLGLVHRDKGLSAWNPDTVRPGWDALMARLEGGACDGVCVFDVERFSRQPIDGERLIRVAGRGLVVVDADGLMDLSTASGKKAFRDAMAAAAYYSDKLKDRVTRGKAQKALGGVPNVSARPFGWEPDGITVREDEAAAIRAVAELFLRGATLDALIAEMDRRGLSTSYGRAWTREGIHRMLVRPRNAGLVTYHRKIVVGAAGVIQPVLDPDVYARVVAKFAGRSPGRQPGERYLLSGLATCGWCGTRLTGRPRPNLRAYPDGSVRRQYWCAPSMGGCTRISIDQRWLDDYVKDWAVRELTDSDAEEARLDADREQEARRAALADEDASIRSDLLAIAARVGRREILLEESLLMTAGLRQRLTAIEEQLAATVAGDEIYPSTDNFRTPDARFSRAIGWLEVATEGTAAEQRAMVVRALGGRRLVIGPGMPSRFDPERVTMK